MKQTLKQTWEKVCNTYLQEFCRRHGYSYEQDMWVANDPGTIACVCDMFVSMEDIRYDIDNCIDIDCFEAWYWKSVDVYSLTKQKYMNYSSFCHGAPDPWTEERLNSIREAQKRVFEAQKNFEKVLAEIKESGDF
jgi:hypothetical protein